LNVTALCGNEEEKKKSIQQYFSITIIQDCSYADVPKAGFERVVAEEWISKTNWKKGLLILGEQKSNIQLLLKSETELKDKIKQIENSKDKKEKLRELQLSDGIIFYLFKDKFKTVEGNNRLSFLKMNPHIYTGPIPIFISEVNEKLYNIYHWLVEFLKPLND